MLRTLVAGLGLALIISSGTAGAAVTAPTAAADGKTPSAHAGRQCLTPQWEPCKTAKQYKRSFKRGDMGRTPYSKGKFTKAFKTKLRKAAVKKGLIPPRGTSAAARGPYKYDGWGDYWDAFNNAMDCVAPGAESSCAEDFDKIKPLEKPAKVVTGCGGLAVAAFYSGGAAVPATAVLAGGLTCSWGAALAAW